MVRSATTNRRDLRPCVPDTQNTVVTVVEMFQKTLTAGIAGDPVGPCSAASKGRHSIVARCLQAQDLNPPPSFKGGFTILTKEEGCRHTPFSERRPAPFYFRTTDVTGTNQAPGRGRRCA